MKGILLSALCIMLFGCSDSTSNNDDNNEFKTTIMLNNPGEDQSLSFAGAQVMLVQDKVDFFVAKGLLQRQMFNAPLFTGNTDGNGEIVINNMEAYSQLQGAHDIFVYVSSAHLNNWDNPFHFTYNSNNKENTSHEVAVENTIFKPLLEGEHFTIRTTTINGVPQALDDCALDDQIYFTIAEPFLEFTMTVVTNGTVCNGADLQSDISLNAEFDNYRFGVDDDGISFINPASQSAYFGDNPQFFSYAEDTIRITRSVSDATVIDLYVVD